MRAEAWAVVISVLALGAAAVSLVVSLRSDKRTRRPVVEANWNATEGIISLTLTGPEPIRSAEVDFKVVTDLGEGLCGVPSQLDEPTPLEVMRNRRWNVGEEWRIRAEKYAPGPNPGRARFRLTTRAWPSSKWTQQFTVEDPVRRADELKADGAAD